MGVTHIPENLWTAEAIEKWLRDNPHSKTPIGDLYVFGVDFAKPGTDHTEATFATSGYAREYDHDFAKEYMGNWSNDHVEAVNFTEAEKKFRERYGEKCERYANAYGGNYRAQVHDSDDPKWEDVVKASDLVIDMAKNVDGEYVAKSITEKRGSRG